MKKQNDVGVEKIVVKYEDGTEKEINKGLVITDNVDANKDHNLTFEFADIKGEEITDIILGVLQLGVELGMFEE